VADVLHEYSFTLPVELCGDGAPVDRVGGLVPADVADFTITAAAELPVTSQSEAFWAWIEECTARVNPVRPEAWAGPYVSPRSKGQMWDRIGTVISVHQEHDDVIYTVAR
jgi:hypothetical protein